eukprot:COSAG04_NODE_6054_length_1421_cov_1.170953_1_plen_53_part_00
MADSKRGALPEFDTVQYLNASVRPVLVDALLEIGRARTPEPAKAFAEALGNA